jgi:transposase
VGDAAGDEAVAQKKSLSASEQSRPDVAAARAAFFAEQIKDVPVADIVVLDESYATTKFTRLRGRALRGVRLRSSVPHGHWKLLTMIAAMTLRGVQASMTIDAATDADVFGAFVEQVLVPTLRPGQVVIMDNLAAHKVGCIVALIERAGCRVIFLPPYSPDFSPIEPMWSKVKQLLRRAAARTVEALQTAVGDALRAITESDCHGYFGHCGYTLPVN